MSATIRRMRVIDSMPYVRPTQARIAASLRKVLPGLQNNTRTKLAVVMSLARTGTLDGIDGGGLAWRWNGTTLLVDREEGEGT
jgi:hypothetical protein